MANDRARTPRPALAVLLGLLLLSPSALAADYYLEGPPQETRSDAVTLSRSVADGGYKARVVRRYRQGVGWQYLLRVEGFVAEDAAREAARAIAGQIGQPVSVYAAEGGQSRTLEVSGAITEPEVEVPPAELGDAEAILGRASRAHGGTKGGLAAIRGSDSVVFRFLRTLPDGLVVEHTWARSGDQRFLGVEVTKGEGRSSRLILGPDGAWLAVDGGPYETTDAQRALDTVAQLEPEKVIPFVLVFADAVENRRELELLQVTGEVEVGGKRAVALRYEGDRTSGPMTVALDRSGWHVLEVSFEDGELVHRFDGWTQTGGLVVPGRVQTWRAGALVDTVEIRALDLQAAPPKEWFDPR